MYKMRNTNTKSSKDTNTSAEVDSLSLFPGFVAWVDFLKMLLWTKLSSETWNVEIKLPLILSSAVAASQNVGNYIFAKIKK